MKTLCVRSLALVLLVLGSVSLSAATTVFEAAGANAAAIQSQVDAFRAALGPNNGVGNPAAGGRREVNWDGVPAQFLDPFPGTFFNSNSPRGVVLSTPGPRMKVSGDPGSPSFLMRDVTAQEWGLAEFSSFSPERFFGPLGSIITDVEFFVPGTQTRAAVRGFGAVFTDIDVANATRIEAWDRQGRLLFSRVVAPPPVASKGLSFLGFVLDAGERAARVRIVSGTHPIDSPFQNPPPDGVGIDDLIYAEPETLADPLAQATWIAAAIRGSGANSTEWRSDLALLNASGFAASYRVEFLAGGTSPLSRGGTLAAGQQTVIQDVVGTLGGNGIGSIRVLSDQPLQVTESIYNIGAAQGGRFGLNLLGRTAAEMLRAGDVALLPHLQHDGTTRTNLGITNTGASAATVNVTLFSDSNQLITYDLTLAPGEVRQENGVFAARVGRSDITFGYARVVVKFGEGIIAYASAVDNVTGDSRVVEMLRLR